MNLADHRRVKDRLILAGLGLLFAIAVYATIDAGCRQDYKSSYLPGWQKVLAGQDPWSESRGTLYSYGPVFNIAAPLTNIHPLLPKLLGVVCWFGLAAWLARRFAHRGYDQRRRLLWCWMFLLLQPVFWLTIVRYGNMDIWMAAVCCGALAAAGRGRTGSAGALLGLGALVKFYPGVLLLAIALRGARIRWRPVLAFLVVFATGYLAAYLVWGPSAFDPLVFAADRPSKLLSIFRFLRGELSPTPNLDTWSLPATAVLVGGAILIGWRARLSLSAWAFALLMALFTGYKAGHPQYVVVTASLLPLVHLDNPGLLSHRSGPGLAAWGYFGMVNLFMVLYWLMQEFKGPYVFVREFVGLIAFPLEAWLLVSFLWAAARYVRPEEIAPRTPVTVARSDIRNG